MLFMIQLFYFVFETMYVVTLRILIGKYNTYGTSVVTTLKKSWENHDSINQRNLWRHSRPNYRSCGVTFGVGECNSDDYKISEPKIIGINSVLREIDVKIRARDKSLKYGAVMPLNVYI